MSHLRDRATLDLYAQEMVAEPVTSLGETPCYLVAHIESPGRSEPVLGSMINALGGGAAIRQRLITDRHEVDFVWHAHAFFASAQAYVGQNIATVLAQPGTRALIWQSLGLARERDATGTPIPLVGYAPTANTFAVMPEKDFSSLRDRVVGIAARAGDPGPWINFITRIGPPVEPPWGVWREDPDAAQRRVAGNKARYAASREAYLERSRERANAPWYKKVAREIWGEPRH